MKMKPVPLISFICLIGVVIFSGFMIFTSCQKNLEDAKEPGEIVHEQDGRVMVYHTFNNDFIEASNSITRVFDTELCVVMYVTAGGGIGAPIPLAELRKSTSTALELPQYCKGSFKESAE